MADLFFKILVETTGSSANTRKYFAFYSSSLVQDTDGSLGAKEIVRRIQAMPSCSYEIGPGEPLAFHGSDKFVDFKTAFSSSYAYTAGETSGSEPGPIIFHDKELSSRNVVRYKFYGPGVAGAIGVADDVWNYPEKFQLAEQDSKDNSFQGDLLADTVFVKEGIRLSSQARVKGNMLFDSSGSSNTGLTFVGHDAAGTSEVLSFLSMTDQTASIKTELDGGNPKMFNIGAKQLNSQKLETRTIGFATNYDPNNSIEISGTNTSLEIQNLRTLNCTGSATGVTDFQALKLEFPINDNAVLGYPLKDYNDGTNTTNVAAANAMVYTLRNNSQEGDFNAAGVAFVLGKRAAQLTNSGAQVTTWSGSAFQIYPVRPDLGGQGHQISSMQVNMPLLASTLESSGSATVGTNLEVATDLAVGNKIHHLGDDNTYIQFDIADQMVFYAGGQAMLKLNEDSSDAVVINEDSGDVNFRVESNGLSSALKVDGGSDFIGIGTGTQDADSLARLTVEQTTGNYVLCLRNTYTVNDSADGLMINYSVTSDVDSSGHFIQVRDGNDDIQYEVRGNNAGGFSEGSSFTAGHDTACEDYNDMLPGMILESTGEMWYKPIEKTSETALPFTKLSNTNGSPTVFGVVGGTLVKYDATGSITNVPVEEQRYIKNGWCLKPAFPRYARNAPTGSGNIHLNTMSIGEGVVWITNINGEVANGDFIESSVIKGYGRKQDDDILRSKTVAKCTETIDWSQVSSSIEHSGSAYKKYLAACTYHCG